MRFDPLVKVATLLQLNKKKASPNTFKKGVLYE
jgi:hypothetical protein